MKTRAKSGPEYFSVAYTSEIEVIVAEYFMLLMYKFFMLFKMIHDYLI